MNNRVGDKPAFRKPFIFSPFREIVSAETTRHGGVSLAPFDTLNLSYRRGDNDENVAENRRRLWQALDVKEENIASSHQVHGTEVLTVEGPGAYEGFDALITDRPGILLSVTVADCTPVLLYDVKNKVVAAAHAGWKGTAGKIVIKTLQRMQAEFGTVAGDVLAYIGTCIDECAYEVGEEVAVFFEDSFKSYDSKSGKYFVDLKKTNQSQLLEWGVKQENIEISTHSTWNDYEDYFSHRRSGGVTGRMLALIGLREGNI